MAQASESAEMCAAACSMEAVGQGRDDQADTTSKRRVALSRGSWGRSAGRHGGDLRPRRRCPVPARYWPGCLDEGRVDAALETVARVAVDLQLLPGLGRAHGVEIRDFQVNALGGFGNGRGHAADNAAEAQHAGIIADDRHLVVECIGLVVQRFQLFAAFRQAHMNRRPSACRRPKHAAGGSGRRSGSW